MFSLAAFSTLALAAFVSAATHDVDVGKDGLTFTPEALFANPGDQVVFHFHPANHTVTQTTFDSVCSPKDGGLDSGFMPVPANQTDNLPTHTVTVTDTTPLWFYCKQAANTPNSHCGKGMIFSINCPASGPNSFDNFKAAALKIGTDLQAATSPASDPYGYSTGSSDPYGYSTEAPTTTTAAPSTGTSAPSSSGNVHQVTVGANGALEFSPANITAQIGDIVSFQFFPKNHTVTQSSFAKPCQRLADDSGAIIALDSGFVPVDPTDTQVHTFNITVNVSTPLWFYCRQRKPDGSSHCGAGMVFSINADETSDKSFSAFKASAARLNGTGAAGTNTSSSSATGTGDDSGAGSRFVLSSAVSLGAAFFAAALLL